jgi:hypothetical protein
MKKETIQEYPINSSELKKEYEDNYNRNLIDNNRFIESASLTFSLMDEYKLKKEVEYFNYSKYGNNPKIANALLSELEKRSLNDEKEQLHNYLKKINYLEPWNIK